MKERELSNEEMEWSEIEGSKRRKEGMWEFIKLRYVSEGAWYGSWMGPI